MWPRVCLSVSPTNAPRRQRVGVRRALAGEVGQEEEPLGARRRRLRFVGEQIVDVDLLSLGDGRVRPGRARCGTTAATRRPTASRPSCATCRGPRGRTCAAGPRGRPAASSLWTNTTPEVPIEVESTPLRTMPLPTAPAAQSPAPPTTTQSVDRPEQLGRLGRELAGDFFRFVAAWQAARRRVPASTAAASTTGA